MTRAYNNKAIIPEFSWNDIDTVLLDMDGTLLDKYFDDYFWEEFVPLVYAEKNGLSIPAAIQQLLTRYRSVQSTLLWTDLDYWSVQLDLDIPELKRKIDHLIKVHPWVIEFLDFLQSKKKAVHLVTAAHSKTLEIKMSKTSLTPYFQSVICAEHVGAAKEQPQFWQNLETMIDYNKKRTLLADDTAQVLRTAHTYGISELIFVAKPSSRRPVEFSIEFPSITFFKELIF